MAMEFGVQKLTAFNFQVCFGHGLCSQIINDSSQQEPLQSESALNVVSHHFRD